MPGGEVEAEAARALLLELTGQAGVAPPAPTHWRLFALLVASPGPLSLRRPSLPPCWSPARLLPLVLQLQPPSRRRVVQRAPCSDKLTVGQRNDDTGLLDSFATAAAEERTGRSCLGSTAACRSRSCLGLVRSLDCSDGCVAMCAFLCIANRIGTSRRRGAAAGRAPRSGFPRNGAVRRLAKRRGHGRAAKPARPTAGPPRGSAAGRATWPWPGGPIRRGLWRPRLRPSLTAVFLVGAAGGVVPPGASVPSPPRGVAERRQGVRGRERLKLI